MNRWLAAIRNLRAGREADREVDEELRAYLAFAADEHERQGLSRADAERAARLDLGGLAQVREGVTDVQSGRLLAAFWQDAAQAVRLLARSPGFAWLMVVMLALGIGAATALFSVVNGVLLRPLPLPRSRELVLVGERVPKRLGADAFDWLASATAFADWQKTATNFSALAALQTHTFTLVASDHPMLLHGARVTTNFFDLLEARPAIGRLLRSEDETDIATQPMVITDRLWRTAFGADPAILGRRIGVPGGQPGTIATVVGVLPAAFHLEGRELGRMTAGDPTDYFIVLHLTDRELSRGPFNNLNYTVIGRLRDGVTVTQALAQLNAIQARLGAAEPHAEVLAGEIMPIQDFAGAEARRNLWVLMASVLAVLLIVCVNLGGLWLTRLADRRREWAIRLALGAAPGRLARQVLGEGAVLGLIGGLFGVGCAALGTRAMLAAAPASLPRLTDIQLDWPVLGFGVGLSLVAGLLTGLLPALRLGAADPQANLKATATSTTADHATLRSRDGLIALQAALAALLVTAAALLGLSFYHLSTKAPGFAADHALAADIVFNPYASAARDRMMTSLPEAILAVPGVTAAAFTSHLPLQGEIWITSAEAPGRTYRPGTMPNVNVRFISPGYLAAMRIPLLGGRELEARDRPAGWPPTSEAEEVAMQEVVVISRAAASAIWPGESASAVVGRQVLFDGNTKPTVVGVAEDARDGSLTSTPPAVVYEPYWDNPPPRISLVVRTQADVSAVAGPIRSAIWQIAPAAPVPTLRPLADLQAEAVAAERYQLRLILLFAAVALLLAGMGVHALVAHSVTRRQKELALRLALGANLASVRALMLRQALTPVALGLLVGLVGALAEGRLLASLLYEVNPASPIVLGSVAVAVLLAALAGWVLPARRVGHGDLVTILRTD